MAAERFFGTFNALFWVVLWLFLAFAAEAQVRVNAIEVEGNQRIPDATIVSLADIQRGAVVSDGQINDALQRIVASGLFEAVDILPQGSGLRIVVVERPTINRISIEGNRRLEDEQLLELISSTPRRVLSPSLVDADAAIISDAYASEARLSVRVSPKIIRRSDNRVDLIFEISEGRVVENERISFVGNRAYSDRRLRRVIETKQAGLLRALIRSDTFIPERIALDRQLLTDFYNARGYVDFEVLDVTTELSRERDATFVTFRVREGQSYSVGDVSVSSEFSDLDIVEYRNALRLRSGQTWSPTRIEEQISRLERLALQQDRDFLRVDPRITRDSRNLELDVEFALVRGPRIFVERIDIEGNQTTLDRVIRNQFDTIEGDPFNPRAIRNAAERIRALGFFSEADVQTREGSANDQVIVDVDVVEQPTGSLTFGGTYNNDTGFALAVGFSERNFLGRGQSLSADIQTGAEDASISLSFREPAFLDRDLTFGIDISNTRTNFDNATFDTRTTGLRPSLAFPVGENSRLALHYEIASEEILDVSADSSIILQGEAGKQTKSAIGYTYTLDLLRGGLNPSRGVRLRFGQEFAGVGGDVEYIRSEAQVVAQRDLFNEEVAIRAILEGGNLQTLGNSASRVTDRFFLSSNQLRGFAGRGVGPRDTGAVDADVLGGNNYLSVRFEADFPLGLPEEYGINGGVFYDLGSVWGLDNTAGIAPVDDGFELRTAVGFSLFWETPIGPLTLSWAKALKKNSLDETKSFNISITTRF